MAYGTMEKIETVTVGSGGTASITFSNIPATYDDLVLVTSLRSSATGSSWQNTHITFNGSSTGYSVRLLYGQDSGTVGSATSSDAYLRFYYSDYADATASTFANGQIYIPNYKSSNNKSALLDSVTETNGAGAILGMTAGLWSNSSAITSIGLTLLSGNFVQHSTATLYGITRVPAGAKATGGVIYDDSSYWYHVFTSSGTFTPSQSISADVLVVAGGGQGGASGPGGGGGAGGLLGHVNQSLTAQNYTVTVGAGGAVSTNNALPGSKGNNSQFGSLTASEGGGGGGGFDMTNGQLVGNGGSGGGGGPDASPNPNTQSGGTATSGQGNNGGSGNYNNSGNGGGGGGASQAGGNGANPGGAGKGGDGSSAYSSWGIATSTGELSGGVRYYAGGGGGAGDAGDGNGGLGGGGKVSGITSGNGLPNTGGGGSGGKYTIAGGAGGSGIVIVRYAK